jgi:hypothetical protein
MFGFAGLPRQTIEVLEAPIRSVRVNLAATMTVTPTVTLSGPCAMHLTISDLAPDGFTLRHRDPLDHEWNYGFTAEASP